MAQYDTSCPNMPDLDGTCEIVNDQCTSYTSDTLGAAKTPIVNTGSGSNLAFKLVFDVTNPSPPPATINQKYKVNATLNGTEYDGGASEDDELSDVDDPWVATATGEPVKAAKAY